MAWTINFTIDEAYHCNTVMGDEMIIAKLDCVSDANGTDSDLKTLDADAFSKILGGWLYEMKIVPGTGDGVPTATWDIDIEDSDNGHILDTDDNAVDAITYKDGASTIGHYPIIEKGTSFVSETLGDANTAVVYLKVLK